MNIKIDLNINAPEWANIVQALMSVIPNVMPNSVGPIKTTNVESKIVNSIIIETSDDKDSVDLTTSPITLEEVRAKLAELSQNGKQKDVKALITKYGAKKLTDIDPASYEELLKEASVL